MVDWCILSAVNFLTEDTLLYLLLVRVSSDVGDSQT